MQSRVVSIVPGGEEIMLIFVIEDLGDGLEVAGCDGVAKGREEGLVGCYYGIFDGRVGESGG